MNMHPCAHMCVCGYASIIYVGNGNDGISSNHGRYSVSISHSPGILWEKMGITVFSFHQFVNRKVDYMRSILVEGKVLFPIC